jgi:hypothetical protein
VLTRGNFANVATGSQTISLGALSGGGGDLGNNAASSLVTYDIGGLNANSTFSGVIGGTTAIGKVGTAWLMLSGNNTWDESLVYVM